jgi:hypothetical protein
MILPWPLADAGEEEEEINLNTKKLSMRKP